MTKTEQQELEKKALEQFMTGKSLFGKDGAFVPMLKSFIEKALEAEMESHLSDTERSKGNKRNGKSRKTVKSSE
ncbi:IS256 family transposase, partial [Aquimarina sp. RZ0]